MNDLIEGMGTFKFQNGNSYVGSFVGEKRNGSGTYTFSNGNVYKGEFANDKINGIGEFTFANGNRYVGQFINEKRNGRGTYYFNNGTTSPLYITSINACFLVYAFRKSVQRYCSHSPLPMQYFISVHTCLGEFVDDKINGHGEFAFTNGNRYVGQFMNEKRNGRGTYYFSNGIVLTL
jgi:hypothetical protein